MRGHPNGLDPKLMTPEERLSEVARLLAAGALRLFKSTDEGDLNSKRSAVRLDFSAPESVSETRDGRAGEHR